MDKDIKVEFTLGDRHFEAVGFLKKGENYVEGNVAIGRVNQKNLVIRSSEDWEYFMSYMEDIPKELDNYALMSNYPHPDDPSINYFLTPKKRIGYLYSPEKLLSEDCLILRRKS